MKIAFATLFTLALAMGIQCSVIPWGVPHLEIAGHGHSYTAVSGPSVAVAHAPAIAVHAPAAVAVHAPAAVAVHAAPWVHADWAHDDGQWHGDWHDDWHGDWHGHGHVHAPVVVVGHGHEGSYIAKTRGAIHTAPLAGHATSAAAINVAPAPGTV